MRQRLQGAADLFLGAADGRVRARKLRRKLRNFQDRQRLALLHVVAYVDVDRADIAGHLGVHINVLERFEFTGDCQGAADAAAFHTGHGGRSLGGVRDGVIGIIRFRRRATYPAPRDKHCGDEDYGHYEPFFSVHFCVLRGVPDHPVLPGASAVHPQNF